MVDKGGVGGQASSSSLIRNYLGFPRGVNSRRLAEQAYEQAWVSAGTSSTCTGWTASLEIATAGR